ncbi:ComF family protein [Sphingobium sufflavum]|uniref:ComF family protein n=1 Tax=Sphingobium sufflavum TaxID=1129547 RepID=UPI001F1D661F|nr:ComF family protein [Sphingobium sufflavum]MCE7797272.1 ComF family protein [Sphingobium sufflavum]
MQALRQIGTAILDFALPPRCPNCLDIVAAQDSFCTPCWRSIHFLGDPCCAACGLPFAYDMGEGALCGACHATPSPFDRARAVMAYGEVARTVVLRFKYGRRTGHARLIARHMARHLAGMDMAQVLLVPVPLHRWRLWSRGFNQAALIARALAREAGGEALVDGLVRTRRTPPLRRMSAARRRRLVQGAFALSPMGVERVRGRHVVLIDDIQTTGATAASCARMLRQGGAARVDFLCWARVLDAEEEQPASLAD